MSLGRLAKVNAAGQLADDDEVDAFDDFRLERGRIDQRRVDGYGPEIGVETKRFSDREQPLLGSHSRRWVIPLRTADRAEQDRIRLSCRLDVLIANRHVVGIDRAAAN